MTGGKAKRPSDVRVRRSMTELAGQATPIERAAPEPEAPSATSVTGRSTRLSVDIDDGTFERLTLFAVRQRVSKVDVMRALLAELDEYPNLAERISIRLAPHRRK